MKITKKYNQVPADELEALGVKDVLRTPAPRDIDRNTWISWSAAQLAVAAKFESVDGADVPRHQIVLNNADGEGGVFAFGTTLREDGAVCVPTVSGGRSTVPLNEQQSAAFKTLVDASIAAGLIE